MRQFVLNLGRHSTTRVARGVIAGMMTSLLTGCEHAGNGALAVPNDKFAGCYDNGCVDAPMLVADVPRLASLSAGTTHTCGLTPSGEAWCWGDNTRGALGDGTDAMRTAPVRVHGALHFASISAGRNVTCGVTRDHAAYCWGSGATGQLAQLVPERCGPGQEMCARQPLRIPNLQAIAIAAGARHACAIDTSGSAYCWGFNTLGETGGTVYGMIGYAPRRQDASVSFTAIGAGDSYSCARTTDGRVYCWGSANRGEIGRPGAACNTVYVFANLCSATPAPVNATATFTSLAVGISHSCGVTSSGSVLCWGDNGQGQLGTRGFVNPVAPVTAHDGMPFSAIAAAGAATCGTPVGRASVCWGLNKSGTLGIGERLALSTAPREIVGARRFTSFAAGEGHVCALTAEGMTYCWGMGTLGQLGAGPRIP